MFIFQCWFLIVNYLTGYEKITLVVENAIKAVSFGKIDCLIKLFTPLFSGLYKH